jgi:hypothetical protein
MEAFFSAALAGMRANARLSRLHATFLGLRRLITSLTPTPRLASMSIGWSRFFLGSGRSSGVRSLENKRGVRVSGWKVLGTGPGR